MWQSYVDLIDKLPEICREGYTICCYKGSLICFHIVEPHEPDRCVRQFGMFQDVPSPLFVYS